MNPDEVYNLGFSDGYHGRDAVKNAGKFQEDYDDGYDDGFVALQDDLDTNWGMGEDW